jgi:hypothetical protein
MGEEDLVSVFDFESINRIPPGCNRFEYYLHSVNTAFLSADFLFTDGQDRHRINYGIPAICFQEFSQASPRFISFKINDPVRDQPGAQKGLIQ